MIERKILTGLIVSSQYLIKIKPVWDFQLIESPTIKKLSRWCWKYFDKYGKAPNTSIEGIFFNKLQNNLDEDLAAEIEQDILPGLSDEFENADSFDWEFLFNETIQYFNQRKADILSLTVQSLLEKEQVDEALTVISEFTKVTVEKNNTLDFSDKEQLMLEIEVAFNKKNENVIYYPGALGEFWNDQLVRGGFVAMLAPEKRGKTFMLIDMAVRACRQGRKVAFFQAGDMSKSEQLKRIGIYLAKKSDKERYCGTMYEPVRDCIFNQINKCDSKFRVCHTGLFVDQKEIYEADKPILIDLYDYHKNEYKPCYGCFEWREKSIGTLFIKKINVGKYPLTKLDAKYHCAKFFDKNRKNFRLQTYSNGTLTIDEMRSVLKEWERDGFVPEVILTDYADLFEASTKEFRHKQNEIWKGHRAISQETNALVVTVTQADADAYKTDTLQLSNFSEDKRKYAHVTAFYGLNQDKTGREKGLGILRINELLLRDGEFDVNRQVKVLQNLKRGRPFLTSYW